MFLAFAFKLALYALATLYPSPSLTQQAVLIPPTAAYVASDGAVVTYDPTKCPDPSVPSFDYCVDPSFKG